MISQTTMTYKKLDDEVSTDGTYVFKKVISGMEAKLIERVQDIPNTQELVEYDHKNRIMVTKFIRGYHLSKGSKEYALGPSIFTQKQFEQLFDTLLQMKDRGVTFEAHYKNLIYHPEDGFTPIDYHSGPDNNIPFYNLSKIISFSQQPYFGSTLLWQPNARIPRKFKHIPEQLLEAYATINLSEAINYQNRSYHNLVKEKRAQEIFSQVRERQY